MNDLAFLILRVAVGAFFAISGYHKLFTPARRERLRKTLAADGVPMVNFNVRWVPAWEFLAGTSLAVGFMTQFHAMVLAIICLVACWAEARDKVEKYNPIDMADRLDDWLYLPEVLYLVILVALLLTGGGAYSLDAFLGL